MRKHMRRIIACTVIVATILTSIVSAHALVMATRYKTSLDFNGSTAHCYASVMDSGKTITITAKLWCGTTLIGTWSDTSNSFVDVSGQKNVQSGQTYTLKVSYKINGVTHYLPVVKKICP